MNLILGKHIEAIAELCHSMSVKRMYVFGSAVNGDFRKESDIDLLISFTEDLSFEESTDKYFDLNYRLHSVLSEALVWGAEGGG